MMKKYNIILVIAGFFVIFGLFPSIHSIFAGTNPSIFVITSPSMKPIINVGDLVFATRVDPSEIVASKENGDIIVIRGPQYFLEKGYPKEFLNLPNNTPIIHRAIEKYFDPGSNQWFFITQGDANQFVDGGWNFLNRSDNGSYFLLEYNVSNLITVPQSEILGKIYFTVPFIGYCAIFSFPIFCILIALCAVFGIMELRGLELSIRIKKRGDP